MLFGPRCLYLPVLLPLAVPILSGLVVHAGSKYKGRRKATRTCICVLLRAFTMSIDALSKVG